MRLAKCLRRFVPYLRVSSDSTGALGPEDPGKHPPAPFVQKSRLRLPLLFVSSGHSLPLATPRPNLVGLHRQGKKVGFYGGHQPLVPRLVRRALGQRTSVALAPSKSPTL